MTGRRIPERATPPDPRTQFKEKPPPAEQLVSLHSCVDRRKIQVAVTGSNAVRSGAASWVLWVVHLNALGQRMTPSSPADRSRLAPIDSGARVSEIDVLTDEKMLGLGEQQLHLRPALGRNPACAVLIE